MKKAKPEVKSILRVVHISESVKRNRYNSLDGDYLFLERIRYFMEKFENDNRKNDKSRIMKNPLKRSI